MEKVTIVVPSMLTVPAIQGGAIEQLLENFLQENEVEKRLECEVIAHYVKGVEQEAEKYQYTRYKYIHYPILLVRITALLRNRMKMKFIPDIWERCIIKKIKELGNKKILFEGSTNTVFKIKKSCPECSVWTHMHSDTNLIHNEKDKIIANELNSVIGVSQYISRQQIKYGMDKSRVSTVLNGIEIENFDIESIDMTQDEILKYFDIPQNKKIILFKGRLIKEKGILELIEAVKKIKDPDILLLIAGSKTFGEKRLIKSSYEKKLREEMESDTRIKILGYVPYNKVRLLHKIAKIAVVPSTCQEACGLTAIEALVSGIPLIASNVGGIPEVVKGTKAVLIDIDNDFVNELSRKLILLLENEDLCKEISESELKQKYKFENKRYYHNLCNVLLEQGQLCEE